MSASTAFSDSRPAYTYVPYPAAVLAKVMIQVQEPGSPRQTQRRTIIIVRKFTAELIYLCTAIT
jgi:hypothetical protein